MASSLPPIKQPSIQVPESASLGNAETEFVLNIEPPSDSSRLWNRMKKEPWIPIGVGLTTASLLMGLRAMARGDKLQSNRFMKYRVGFQYVTAAMLAVGIYRVYDQRKPKSQTVPISQLSSAKPIAAHAPSAIPLPPTTLRVVEFQTSGEAPAPPLEEEKLGANLSSWKIQALPEREARAVRPAKRAPENDPNPAPLPPTKEFPHEAPPSRQAAANAVIKAQKEGKKSAREAAKEGRKVAAAEKAKKKKKGSAHDDDDDED